MFWLFVALAFTTVTYPKLSKWEGLKVYDFNQPYTPPTPTENQILWDDNTAILWDDSTAILWDD